MRICRICKVHEGGWHKMSCNFSKYNLPVEWIVTTEPESQHDETDDEAPPQWDEQPAQEDGH